MSEQERIATPCPTCGHTTLFVGSGGHLTCSWLQCKEPSVEVAIDRLMLAREGFIALGNIVAQIIERAETGMERLEAIEKAAGSR